MKRASAKSSHTAMCIMAAACAQTPFYNEKINLFLAKCPAVEAKGTKFEELHKEISGLPLQQGSVSRLAELAGQLPDLQESLMPGFCDELLQVFGKKVHSLYHAVVAMEDADFEALQLLLTEACSTLPLDGELAELCHSCAALLQQSGSKKLLEKLQQQARAVADAGKGDSEAFLGRCLTWGATLATCSLSADLLSDAELHSTSQEALQVICSVVGSQLTSTLEGENKVEQMLNTASQASKVVEGLAEEKYVAILQSGLHLHRAYVDVSSTVALATQKAQLADVKKVVELKRSLVQVQALLAADGVETMGFLDGVLELVEKGQLSVNHVTDNVQGQCSEDCEAKHTLLAAVAGGLPAGKMWLEDAPKESLEQWESMMEYASKSLLLMEGEYLVASLETCQKVC